MLQTVISLCTREKNWGGKKTFMTPAIVVWMQTYGPINISKSTFNLLHER